MITVTLGDKDFDRNGFVYVSSIAYAVLDAMGGKVKRLELYPAWPKFIGPPSPFPVQYEIERYPYLKQRAVWEKIDAAVAARHLTPIDSKTTAARERYDFEDAVVPFDEVALWGKTIGHYSFQRANATSDADKVAANETAAKVCHGGTAVSILPPGIPTRLIVQNFKLSDAWKSKLTHIKSHPFLKDALMKKGCRKLGKTPATSHLWNPVQFAEILIERDGRNRRAMEAIITHHFKCWQDVWHESMEGDEAEEYAA